MPTRRGWKYRPTQRLCYLGHRWIPFHSHVLPANAAGSAGVILTSPNGINCVRLSLQNGATAADLTPVDCGTGADLDVSQVDGAWQLGGGQYPSSCNGYFDDPVYAYEGAVNTASTQMATQPPSRRTAT